MSIRKRLKRMQKRALSATRDATARFLRRPRLQSGITLAPPSPSPSPPPSTVPASPIPAVATSTSRSSAPIAPSNTDKYLVAVASGCALAETIVDAVPIASAFSGVPAAVRKGAQKHLDVRQCADDAIRERTHLSLLAESFKLEGDAFPLASEIQEFINQASAALDEISNRSTAAKHLYVASDRQVVNTIRSERVAVFLLLNKHFSVQAAQESIAVRVETSTVRIFPRSAMGHSELMCYFCRFLRG
ncbi:hypothetical protein CYLTODRAFT_55155 [Cylindrobasidium torrendii FP15055 ss-10]|uniref:Uncharacterized protein n=1 Tax=Cylindrobasidium torrendii FP15055 ss-10 TaxID=1314674 RepID=A0A0D7BNZ3_9AGAR|nr:hypothetical protein CYLTODRAFT_55155 [Cylindrobasidium torrendii FP15055 ss-10]